MTETLSDSDKKRRAEGDPTNTTTTTTNNTNMSSTDETPAAAAAASAAATETSKPKKKQRIVLNPESPAQDICAGFFTAMDLDGNGFIEESEVKTISIVAFDESEDASEARWQRMLKDMDSNNDQKISKDEYITWWMSNTNNKTQPDGSFVEGYAVYLLKSLLRITSVKTANDICDAFFETMDANGDGYLVESEVRNISRWAFGAKADTALSTWIEMKDNMDTNNDQKISKEEYGDYWMSQTKEKIRSDGTFVDGYRHYLMLKLAKLKAGKKRQDQVKVWNSNYADEDPACERPASSKRVSIAIETDVKEESAKPPPV